MRRVLIVIRVACLALLLIVGLQVWNLSGEETTLSELDNDLASLETLIQGPEEPAEEPVPENSDPGSPGESSVSPEKRADAGKGAATPKPTGDDPKNSNPKNNDAKNSDGKNSATKNSDANSDANNSGTKNSDAKKNGKKSDGKKSGPEPAKTDASAVPMAGAAAGKAAATKTGAGKTIAKAGAEKGAESQKKPPRKFPSHYELIGRSGIFGFIPKKRLPPPGLEGIAGGYACIRSPSGATGLVEEGKEYQGIKVLKIGTNRVLVEYQGKKQELTLHSGLGGETLMPPPETKTATEKKGKP